jgi:hypothetical protein
MQWSGDDVRAAGRLIQWGLRPKERPAQEPDYSQLVERFLDEPDFRVLVREMAQGLGLEVLDVGPHGMALGASPESAFALRPSDFRANATVDDRLLDGLVQLAIAATIFPRSRDLDDDPTLARPPVQVTEVDETLRALCQQLADEARGAPDPMAGGEDAGLDEAWRAYQRRLATHETRDGRAARRGTLRIIEANLERLRDLGAFIEQRQGQETVWQPLWRYQVLVKELAATAAYVDVRKALERRAAATNSSATEGERID